MTTFNGEPFIAHRDETRGILRVSRRTNGAWQHISPQDVGSDTGFRPTIMVDANGMRVFHGTVPSQPDVTADGVLWLSTGAIGAAQLGMFSFDDRSAGGGQAIAAGPDGHMLLSRRLQRSALFGQAEALDLWTAPDAGRQTNVEFAGGGDQRHLYSRLNLRLDSFGLPIIAYADRRAAFGDDPATVKTCLYIPDDSDSDGLPDPAEVLLGTDPNEVDTDGDGRSDGEEYLVDNTDPRGCDDGVLTTNETDIDCGGRCGGCAFGQTCVVHADCTSQLCEAGVCDEIPACDDGRQNGDESDVDCGGSCAGCPNDNACLQNADCSSQLCMAQVCQPQPTCEDGIQNGSETAVDCGGADCVACPNGSGCGAGADCVSTFCGSGTCQDPPRCDDEIANGNETGQDCGGPDCEPCSAG